MEKINTEQLVRLAQASDAVSAIERDVEIVMPPEIVNGVSNEECVDEDALMLSTLPSAVAGPVTASVHKGSYYCHHSTKIYIRGKRMEIVGFRHLMHKYQFNVKV